MKESSSVMNTFAAVVEEFGPAVFRLSLALTGNEEVANDIYQQTFLLLLEKKPRFSHRAQLNVWLLRSARKLAATEMRRFDNSKTVPITETTVPAATQEHSFEFLDLMSVLSEKYREVTVLFYIEDMTVYDISCVLGISVPAVKTRLSRARTMLGKIYKEELL